MQMTWKQNETEAAGSSKPTKNESRVNKANVNMDISGNLIMAFVHLEKPHELVHSHPSTALFTQRHMFNHVYYVNLGRDNVQSAGHYCKMNPDGGAGVLNHPERVYFAIMTVWMYIILFIKSLLTK